MIQNLTAGKPSKLILLFCLPLLIGNLFQQLYNITDTLIVGRLLGVNALAAVGATAPIFFVFLLIAFGFAGGLTVITAQRFGAGDIKGVRSSVTHAIRACAVLCFLMTFILIFCLKPILRLMNVPLEIEKDAYTFMSILSFSLVVIVFYNLLFGVVRALGDSKTPLYFLIFSTLLNIAFNFVLIYFFKFGVAGSALGTFLAISIAFILCGAYVYCKYPVLHLQKSDWRFDPHMLKSQLNVALPMSVQFSVLSVSMMVIQGACNSFGPDVIAAFTAALRIEQLATQPLLALGMAMATYSAQNWGAGKISRIRQGVRLTALWSLILSILMSLAVRYIGRDMISVFLPEENNFIIETGKTYLSISTLFYFFLGLIFIFRNTLQGMGKAIIPLVASLTELFVRSVAAVYFAKLMGYKGIFYASPIAWIGATLVVTVGYILTIKNLRKTIK
ncbi:MAG TPA: MATE family efflux transporter [Alphaproteobacteria bacterium]|nr:MATE family efflux transporter [Alphaproteobacteria bacterium]